MADVLQFPSKAAVDSQAEQPADWSERERALDVRASWIVEAPAGSGKTALLIQRYLKLLGDASVEEPEQVLAITFTVKATTEMRDRIVDQLEAAARGLEVDGVFEGETRMLAEAVLRRDEEMGWGLRERPHRMRIATIDSVCAEIARSLPVLSESGGRLSPVADASALYQRAARQTLMQLGGDDTELDGALQTLLLHRDGSLTECERLIAEMLALRNQWGRLIPLRTSELDERFLEETVLPQFERALELAICQSLSHLDRVMPSHVLRELTEAAAEFAYFDGYRGSPSPIAFCAGRDQAPEARTEHLAHWRALVHLVVTPSSGGWRKSFNINHVGFVTDKTHKTRLADLIARLHDRDDVLEAMCRLDDLPPVKYPSDQWAVAKALFRVLGRAMVELQLVFGRERRCDFTEMELAARTALTESRGLDDLSAALGRTLKHLLVDEMQDTSSSQYELIERLTEGWDGQSQTLFLVGDPKQSIYRFRQARVERFMRTMHEQKLGELRLGCLRLSANFRSQGGLVEQFNEDFAKLFPPEIDISHPEEVSYHPAAAVRMQSQARGVVWHPSVIDAGPERERARRRQLRRDAAEVREIAMAWLGRPLPPGRTKPWRVAVLLRTRSHVGQIVAELKRESEEGKVSYFATEIDALSERQEVLDLLGLTRALLHPADRVAWLAVLHAPWCGLGLADLHTLAGSDDLSLRESCVLDLMGERGHMLSQDGEERVARVWPVLQAAAGQRGKLPFAEIVERTWHSLGGDASLNAEEKANALRFLRLLNDMELEDDLIDLRRLTTRVKSLFAEANHREGAVELITIHKAKGLEWDVVIVPALERRARTDRGKLLDWMEMDSSEHGAAQIVLAPIVGKGEESSELHRWIRSVDTAREAAERKRLLYVACTRAREELHLFAMPERNAKGEISVASNSLLEAAWPIAETLFASPGNRIGFASEPVTADFGGFIEQIAATGVDTSELEEAAGRSPVLHRLPSGYDPLQRFIKLKPIWNKEGSNDAPQAAFTRPEGSLAARAFGNAVHAFLEMMAERLADGEGLASLIEDVQGWRPRVTALLRGDGLAPTVVERQAGRVVETLKAALDDAYGRWILRPHRDAASEISLTRWQQDANAVRTGFRLDRVFRGGPAPLEHGEDYLWIVDYKTSDYSGSGVEEFLSQEKQKYRPQLEAYAQEMAQTPAVKERPPRGLRLALYYPSLRRCVWWIPETVL